jgi:hypothetical protein
MNVDNSKLNNKRIDVENNYNTVVKELEASLDKYMKNLPETPLSLPIKTKLVIVKKNHTIDHLMLSPTDTFGKLNDMITNYFTNLNDEIISKSDSCGFYIRRKEFEADINSELKEINRDIKLNENSIVLSMGLMPGEIIYYDGDYRLKSEAPRVCIKVDFEKLKGTSVSYFACDNCGLKCIIFDIIYRVV